MASWDTNDTTWQASTDDAWKAASGDTWEKPAEDKVEETAAWDSTKDQAWSSDAAAGDAADPWKTAGDAAAGASWDDSAWKAADNKWLDEYSQLQSWSKTEGRLARKTEEELVADEALLFEGDNRVLAGIDFSHYDNVPVDVSGNKCEHIPMLATFAAIHAEFKAAIPDALMENITRSHYTTPTPVQKYAIPVGLAGRDVMCCAQTGSGKTTAFLVPVIGRMMAILKDPVGARDTVFEGICSPDTVILAPTRELCLQIFDESLRMTHRTSYRACRVYGGEKPKAQIEELARGCDLLVGTPGRLLDFINKDLISVEKTFMLVLDEADRMLDMGFEKQIRDIVMDNKMPDKDNRQTMMFSATFPEECQRMAQDFLYEYIWIGVGVVGGAVNTVAQELQTMKPAEKYEKLIEVLDNFYASRAAGERVLIFVNAKDTAKWLDEQLYAKHFDTGALHGNLEQVDRENNLKRFRNGEISVLVATDVASRGLDIAKVETVVNYDFPQDIDTYVHRIGRSGRIGNKGRSVTFISTDDLGCSLENTKVLKELTRIMADAKCEIPDFLEGLISSQPGKDGGGWQGSSWESVDARPAWGKEAEPAAATADQWGKESGDTEWKSSW